MKTPPYCEQSEQSVLGSLLQEPDRIFDIDYMESKMFYFEKHQEIFSKMKSLLDQRKEVDIITVSTGVKEFDIGYLGELITTAFTASHIKTYGSVVKDKYLRRKLILSGDKITSAGYNESLDSVKELELAKSIIDNSIGDSIIDTANDIDNLSNSVFEDFITKKERIASGSSLGIETGFSFMNFEPGNLVAINALPKMGKSILVTNIACNSSFNHKTLFFSFEMSKTEITQRMIAHTNRTRLSPIQNIEIEEELMAEHVGTFKRSCPNLKIVDITYTIDEVYRMCKKEKALNGLELVVIDYAQITGDNLELVPKCQHVTRISKRIAQDMNCVVVLLSQFNREGKREFFPRSDQILGGESVVQNCNQVFILHNATVSDENNSTKDIEPIYILRKTHDRSSNKPKADYYLKREQDIMTFTQEQYPPNWIS